MAKKILIVDDDEALSGIVAMQFKDLGHDVSCTNDGYDALQRIKTEKPDLLILDVMLPKMDGFHICRLIKFDRNFKDIPVLMYSSLSEDKHELGEEVGADAYLPKPFKLDVLMQMAKDLLNRPAKKQITA